MKIILDYDYIIKAYMSKWPIISREPIVIIHTSNT